jgi:hypothetical protein
MDAVGSDWEDVEEEEEVNSEEEDRDEEYAPAGVSAAKDRKRPRLTAPRPVAEEAPVNMGRVGIEAEEIIKLINNEETRESIIQKTGFSPNYVMKLQRRVLRSSPGT